MGTAIIGTCAVLALLAAAARTPGRARRSWYCVGVGVAGWLTGDLIRMSVGGPHSAGGGSLLVDAAYLTGSCLLGLGLRPGRARRPAASLEAGVVAAGGAALTWIFVVVPLVRSHGLSLPAAVLLGTYPALSLGLLALAARLLFDVDRTRAVPAALTVGMLAMVFADAGRGLQPATASMSRGTSTGLGWLLFYAATGLAAVLADPRAPVTADSRPAGPGTRPRVLPLACTGSVAPVLLVVGAAGRPGALVMLPLAVISLGTFALVVVRVARLLLRVEGTADRLRARGAELEEQTRVLRASLDEPERLEGELRQPRSPRRTDRPAEPDPVRGPPPPRPEQPKARPGRGRLHRPRRFQGHQRHRGPSGG